MPEGIVRATVSNEFLRRFKSTSRDLEPEEVNRVTSEYCQDLKKGWFL